MKSLLTDLAVLAISLLYSDISTVQKSVVIMWKVCCSSYKPENFLLYCVQTLTSIHVATL